MRKGAPAGVVAAMMLVGTGVAQASTAEYSANGMFSFTGAPGERNDVTFSGGAAGFRVRDAGNVVTPGLGCVPVGLDTVECTLPPTGYQQCFLGDCFATVDLGDGDDRAVVPFRLASSTTVKGGPGDDRLEGGEGTLNLDGGDGDDTLLGSAEGDSLIGGLGADLIDGRGGRDSAGYGDRNVPVRISLDERANDGEPGERDDVRAELVSGGGDADTIVGGPGDEQLYGGGGADTIDGGPGQDELFGGGFDGPDPGDTLRCGDGDDVAALDDADVAALDCEVAGAGLFHRTVVIDARTVRASRKGVVRLTVRRIKVPPTVNEFEQPITGTLRLTDAAGRAVGTAAPFSLKLDEAASVTVKLSAATRRRLVRAPGGRLALFGVRDVSQAVPTTPPSVAKGRFAGAVTLLAPRRR